MVKVVVTGGAGFIGSNLAIALLERGNEVTVIDNLATGNIKNLSSVKDKIVMKQSDINDTEQLKKMFEGVDCVFHQAAVPSVVRSIEDPQRSHQANASGTLSVLVAARDAKVRRVVYASSSSVYGDNPKLPKKETMATKPLSPYASTKLIGEQYCEQFYKLYGLETVSLRYFNVFGERQNAESEYAAVIPKFITAINNDEQPTIFGNGTVSRDFTYVQNVVHANVLAMNAKKAPGQVFNIACGDSISLLQLLEKINKILGRNITPIFEPPRKGDIPKSLADIRKAKKILKYEPIIQFDEGLKKTISWFTGEKHE